MGWDLKVPAWDLAALGRDTEPCLGSVVVGSSGCGSQLGDVGCSVDLKLGGLGDLVPNGQPMLGHGAPKRRRNAGNGGQKVACLVDGCVADLSGCREYHRRHKVCEDHSKTPVVRVGGREQRFCQQCSRFHSLVEFDEVKRSCRKRLDGHNRRRRKSHTDPINSGTLFSNTQGSNLSVYLPVCLTATPEPSWSGIVKSGHNALYAPRTEGYCKERNKFPSLQEIDAASFSRNTITIGTPAGQPHLRAFMASASSSNANNSVLTSSGSADVFDSDCVLSLLSAPAQMPSIKNLAQMVTASRGQPQGFSLQCGGLDSNKLGRSMFLCPGMKDEHTGSFLVSDANDSGIHFQSGFDAAGSSDCSSPSFPFCWQ